ncbi:MAG: hypothetical protein HY727_15110 [Candidatus Rokubacteria bacterium]|nr:hypothetical protein [Candidatus Rokubacteria bacterium]
MSLWLLLGGMAGALLRAVLGQQRTWSRRSALDILTGGALAVVLPALAGALGVALPTGLDRLVYLCAGFVLGGFGNYILVALLWRFGVFREDPRAARPEGNGGTP